MAQEQRRKFLLVAGALLTAPLAAEAQQAGKVKRVGVLWHAGSREEEGPIFDAFTAGLRERGYDEGRIIVLEHRFASEMPERFRSMAAELVALKPDLLVGVSPPSAVALKNTGTSIPIVFTVVGDAVVLGLVRNLPRPGENITGFTILSPELTGKRPQLLLEILPDTKRVGVLYNPDSPLKERFLREVASAIQVLRLEQLLVEARNGAEAGSLFSYGPDLPEIAKQTCDYVVKILQGARPGDLPVVQPTRFELVFNLKTARALGINVPQSILIRANRVIE